MPLLPRVARAKLHHWEEPCISGTNGSGTVFFSGCSLNCVFCQNDKISHQGFGKTVSVERLADIFHELYKQGAHNINLVSPTHYVHAIKDALDLYKPPIPIVYNSGGYDRVESLKILEGYIDIYLIDFKPTSPVNFCFRLLLHNSSSDISPVESPDSYKLMGLIVSQVNRPVPECVISLVSAGTAEPVSTNCPSSPR